MSIPAELSDLQYNLDAAKLAIKDMGGTYGDTGYGGLADEINSIPMGGGTSGAAELAPIESDYGVLFYYADMEAVFEVMDYYGCTINSIDAVKLQSFLAAHPPYNEENIEFYYQSYGGTSEWSYMGASESVSIPVDQMTATTGIDVTATEQWAQMRLARSLGPKEGSLVKFAYLTQSEYESLATNSGASYTIGTDTVIKEAIYRFDFGKVPTSVGNYFLYNVKRMKKLNFDYAYHLDTIGNYFLYGCNELECTEILPSTVVSIGTNFGNRLTKFNAPIYIPSGITAIPNSFLTSCDSFNSSIVLNNVTSIGNSFLSSSSSFNQPLDISRVTSVGNYFLSWALAFNKPLDTSNLNSIGTYFLQRAESFNQPITLKNSCTVGDNFMINTESFNSSVNIPTSWTTTPKNFLYNAHSFNQPINLNNVTTLEENFLAGYTTTDEMAFNQPIDLSRVTTIKNFVFKFCVNFNQPLNVSSVVSVYRDFLGYARSFNQPLVFTSATYMGNGLLMGAESFNSTLSFPSLTGTVYPGGWLMGAKSFTQPIDLSSATRVSFTDQSFNYFYLFRNMDSWTGPLILGNAAISVPSSASYQQYGFSTTNVDATCYTTGITIKGTNRSTLMNFYTDRNTSPYRKLVDGGAS